MTTGTITAPPGKPPVAPAPPPRKGRTAGIGRLASMLLSPTYVVLALVVGYPILAALYLSLFRANDTIDPDTGLLGKGDKFVGLGNYADAFTGETGKRFLNAFENTTLFTICTVVLEVAIGVSMALIMNKAFRGRALVRASILVPWAIPTAVSAVLWGVMFQPSGVVNEVLSRGDNPILWSADNGWSFLAVVIADVWKTAPFVGLLTLAGLQIIPAEVYEAAKIDGSNAWQTFWRVTLPLVKPALIVAVLFRLLDVLRMFDLPQVLIGTNKHSVETLSQFAFDEMSNLRYGPASAYATLLFLYVVIIAFVFVRVLGADVIGSRVGGKK